MIPNLQYNEVTYARQKTKNTLSEFILQGTFFKTCKIYID